MTTPAVRDNQSSLEAVLEDVHTTLADLLVAADEQYAAVSARDRDRVESVTRQQELLSSRLARAELTRQALLNGESLAAATSSSARARALHASIADAVTELRIRQARTASLLQRSIELTSETLAFLTRLVTAPSPAYGSRGLLAAGHSVLVDGRA